MAIYHHYVSPSLLCFPKEENCTSELSKRRLLIQISGRRAAEPQELKCTQEGCDEVFFRSALMKRHLLEVHNVKVDAAAADSTPNKQIKQEISSPVSAEGMWYKCVAHSFALFVYNNLGVSYSRQ